jgi:putative ABC transport system permease protein
MTFISEWKIAFKNLFRNPRRTVSTSLALVVGFVGLALLSGHIYKTERTLRTFLIYLDHLGHISIYKTDGFEKLRTEHQKYQISETDLIAIRSVLQTLGGKIELAAESITGPALLSTGLRSTPILLNGISPELDGYTKNHPEVKKWAREEIMGEASKSLQDFTESCPNGISISKGVGELIGRISEVSEIPIADRDLSIAARTLDGNLNAVNATLVLKHTTGMPYVEDLSVIAPQTLLKELFDSKGVDDLILYLKDPSEMKSIINYLNIEFKKLNLDVEVFPFNSPRVGAFYVGTMGFLLMMCGFFTLLILGTSALVMVNSMTMNVLERSKEIGTLRSLGYTAQRVTGMFIKEAVWISLFSALIGIILSVIISLAANSAHIMYESPGSSGSVRFQVVVPPLFYAVLTGLLVLISISTSYFVVRKKTKERIASLLLDSGASA